MGRICIVCLLALSLPGAAWARMYQWVDPHNGRTHMSGTPPVWYRSGQAAPRIFVFENGQIIDDTRIAVSEETRRALREQAFKNTASINTPGGAAVGAAGETTTTSVAPATQDAGTGTASSPTAIVPIPDTSPSQNVSPDVLAKLKEALQRWDQQHSAGLALPPPASARTSP